MHRSFALILVPFGLFACGTRNVTQLSSSGSTSGASTSTSAGGYGDSVAGIEFRTDDRDHAAEVARRIQDAIGSTYHVMDWMALNAGLLSKTK